MTHTIRGARYLTYSGTLEAMTTNDTKKYIIDTASGVRLNLDDPQPEDIQIEDVAGGLSKVCRFAAQTLEYYSVAQHAVLVRQLVVEAGHPELALVALHHDSHEAYIGDVPKPLKNKIAAVNNAYDQVSDKFDLAIAEAFGFVWPEKDSQQWAAIKRADRQALIMEAKQLLPDCGEALRQDPKFDAEEFSDLEMLEKPLSPTEAEALFREAHKELLKRTTQKP